MEPTNSTSARRERRSEACAWIVLLGGVLAVYGSWSVLTGRATLLGADFAMLHERRMAFARAALFSDRHDLPAWYSRELLGTPFRANLQSFPWIPTRLLVFALFDPEFAYLPAVVLSAGVAAAFTYLLCRRFERSRAASVAAGWTFACCGFFASRVTAGHLPLLEAFPALPVLLYAVERVVSRVEITPRRVVNGPFAALAGASACFMLVGHPQLVVYSLAVAAAFAFVRARRASRAWSAVFALALGAGLAAFALVPMASLAGRSTRVLELDAATNDLPLPYARLGALLFPWKDGWPASVQRTPAVAFHGYASEAFFWDSVSYVGWLPCIAVVALLIAGFVRRERTTRTGLFFTAAGVLALAFALPWVRQALPQLPGTLLRSPSRLLFVVSFCLALALALGVDRLAALISSASSLRWLPASLVAVVLALHGVDLGSHSRSFVAPMPERAPPDRARMAEMRTRVADGRIGIDYGLITPYNRDIDDVGCFDSLLLARPYRFLIETSGMPARTNEQALDAAQLTPRTLRACGVRFVWTVTERKDLHEVAKLADSRIYQVDSSQARADFVPTERVDIVPTGELHRLLRDPSFALERFALIDESWRSAFALTPNPTDKVAPASVRYLRPSSDAIAVTVDCAESGLVRVLEAWDPGWSATLDHQPVNVVPAHDTFLAVAVEPGQHSLRFEYHTPGAGLGLAVSLASAALLALLARWLR